MGKRNIEIKVRLKRKEAELLNKHVKKSRLSREAYLRHLINGLVPQDAPPPAYFDFMRELHSIGNNLNQIAQKAHVLGEDLIRAQELTDEARLLSHHSIDTLEQLNAYEADVKSQLTGLTEQRKSLYRKLRTKAVLADPARHEQIRAEIAALSGRLKDLRREVKLCEDIAARSLSLKEKIRAAREEQQAGKTDKARQEAGRTERR